MCVSVSERERELCECEYVGAFDFVSLLSQFERRVRSGRVAGPVHVVRVFDGSESLQGQVGGEILRPRGLLQLDGVGARGERGSERRLRLAHGGEQLVAAHRQAL